MSVRIIGPDALGRYGLETALAIEGIGHSPRADTAMISAALEGSDGGRSSGPCLYFGSIPHAVARKRFGAEHAAHRDASVIRFRCSGSLWSAEELALMDRFGSRDVSVPAAGCCDVTLAPDSDATVLLRDERGRPLVLRRGEAIWCPLDLATSLALLISERYAPAASQGLGGWLATWRPLQQLYYWTPRAYRARIQRGVIQRMEERLRQRPAGQIGTSYPVDLTGWVLVRALINALQLVADHALPTIDPWPPGYRACVVVTHDIEPTRFAYRRGLPRLLRWLAVNGHPPHTIDPVAQPARRYPRVWQQPELAHHEIVCHGWLHDGRKTRLSRDRMRARLVRAKSTLETLAGRPVTAFRSPRLDRNDALYEALEASGFRCDSTVPDADRENMDRWGSGCSMNFPFHPMIPDGAGWRRLNLLECPVTAPDCAMPVFAGHSVAETCALYDEKLDYVEAIRGCYVAIFHSGTFDDVDADLRERLLSYFAASAARRTVWRCSLGQLERWWRAREALRARVVDGALVVANTGSTPIGPVMVRWRRGGEPAAIATPPLEPGAVWSSHEVVVHA